MCRLLTTRFFYKCGHIVSYKLPSVNLSCQNTSETKCFDFDSPCPVCSNFAEPATLTYKEAIPCGGFSGKRAEKYTFQSSLVSYYTPSELWKRRSTFLSQINEQLAQKFEFEVCLDEEIRGVHPIERTYFLSSKKPIYPFFHELTTFDKDTQCGLCEFKDSEFAFVCASKSQFMLPCGHVFGWACVEAVFEVGNSCPSCGQKFVILRDADMSKITQDDLLGYLRDRFLSHI